MPFNSLKFLLVLLLIFVIHWAIPAKYNLCRKVYLILVSYLLYMNWKPTFALVLFGVTVVTFCGGLVLQLRDDGEECLAEPSGKNERKVRRKKLAWFFALIGLLPLLVFKYYNFLNESISAGLAALGLQFAMPGLNWAVPVGISFFTFQAVGYMLDVYHGRIKAEKNFVDYLLFVSFFPQIASGPISKTSELLPQIKKERAFNCEQAASGLRYLLWGMFLKVALADRAGIYVDTVFSEYPKFSGLGCFIGSLLYSIQIYSDFAGYSLMAVGVGKVLGFDLINNFKRPYFSVSITDFWRRWHISLSRWLKDYVYIPLGGSRCSKPRNYCNIFVTFLVSGIWHGANWTFIVWGILHGVCQIIEKMFGWNKKDYGGLARFGRIVLTFLIVTITWTIFRSPSIAETIGYFARYASMSGSILAEGSTLVYTLMALIPVVIYEVLTEFFPATYKKLYRNHLLRWVACLGIFTLLMLIGVFDGSSFIYVSF